MTGVAAFDPDVHRQATEAQGWVPVAEDGYTHHLAAGGLRRLPREDGTV